MINSRLAACLMISIALLVLIPLHTAEAQNYFEYNIQVRSDGSAVWTIKQFSSANATVDTWDAFQQKVFDLVDSAAAVTLREMNIDENSLQINTVISAESKTTEYSFVWQNFSQVQGSELIMGDVFQVGNFFDQLYGDAALQLSYPSDFGVKSASPAPYERLDSSDLLRWSRTQDLVTNNVSIVLSSDIRSIQPEQSNLLTYVALIVALAVAVCLFGFGFQMFKRRKLSTAITVPTDASPFVSEEEKVLKLLKASGGSMRQSKITEQSRFSKAKTSQLLTALEKRGIITRYKNGRDKIVTLRERERE